MTTIRSSKVVNLTFNNQPYVLKCDLEVLPAGDIRDREVGNVEICEFSLTDKYGTEIPFSYGDSLPLGDEVIMQDDPALSEFVNQAIWELACDIALGE